MMAVTRYMAALTMDVVEKVDNDAVPAVMFMMKGAVVSVLPIRL